MNIIPISIMNSFKAVNNNQNRVASNVFAKNNAVDTVSFSGKGTNVKSDRYIPETREARLIQGGDNRLDEKSASVLGELDNRTNAVVEKANKINAEAQDLRETVMESNDKNDTNVMLDLSPNETIFAHLSGAGTVDTIYKRSENPGEKSKSEIYVFDPKTQKLAEYAEGIDASSDKETRILFADGRINGEVTEKEYSSMSTREKFYIDFNYLGKVGTARFTNPFYVGSTTKEIQKTEVAPEHGGSAGFALTESYKDPFDSRKKEKMFMKWITYED